MRTAFVLMLIGTVLLPVAEADKPNTGAAETSAGWVKRPCAKEAWERRMTTV